MNTNTQNLNGFQLLQKLTLSKTFYNFAKRKLVTTKENNQSEEFIPFVQERQQNGKLNLKAGIKKDFEEDGNLKPKRKNKSIFLRDIYTSAPQISALQNNATSNWEALTTEKQNKKNVISLQKELGSLLSKNDKKFQKSDRFLERYSLQNKVDPQHQQLLEKFFRKSGALGKHSVPDIPPPLGYYESDKSDQLRRSKYPMLVCMEKGVPNQRSSILINHSLSTPPSIKCINDQKGNHKKTTSEQLGFLSKVSPDNFRHWHAKELQQNHDRTRFTPSITEIDPNAFQTFTKNIDKMRKKLKDMKFELTLVEEKQNRIFRNAFK